jgi:hypothetical protein
MPPVYPVLAADEHWRVQEHARNEGRGRPEVERHTSHARWLYRGSRGTFHVFHDHGPLRRRRSFDERKEFLQDAAFCKPHPARMKALVPLDQKRPLEDLLEEKTKWHLDEMRRRQRHGSQDSHSSQRLTSVSEDDAGPAGSHETGTPHQPGVVRRWSLPNLDDLHGFMGYHSWSRASSNSRRTSEPTDSGKPQVKKWPWILKSAIYVFKSMFVLINMVLCCGPCTFLYFNHKQIKRHRRFGGSKVATGLDKFVLEAPEPLCECRICDLDFSDSGWDPDFPNTGSALRSWHDRNSPSYVFSPRYTATVPLVVLLFLPLYLPLRVLWQLGKRRKWDRKIKAVWNYEILPAMEGARDKDRKPVHEVADTIRGRQARRMYKREKVLDPERAEVHEDSVAPSVEYDSDDAEQRREHNKRRLQRIVAAFSEARGGN